VLKYIKLTKQQSRNKVILLQQLSRIHFWGLTHDLEQLCKTVASWVKKVGGRNLQLSTVSCKFPTAKLVKKYQGLSH